MIAALRGFGKRRKMTWDNWLLRGRGEVVGCRLVVSWSYYIIVMLGMINNRKLFLSL